MYQHSCILKIIVKCTLCNVLQMFLMALKACLTRMLLEIPTGIDPD